MKDYRIDELSKELAATPVSRRRALRLLLGTAAAGLLSAVAAPGAYAARKCRAIGQTCQSDAQCCSRYCDNQTFKCGCPPGTRLCGNTCVAECAPPKTLNTQTCQCECPQNLPKECGETCCASNATCCPGGICCQSGTSCCGNTCCPSGTQCTTARTCCPTDRFCSGECCPPGFVCTGGRCVVSTCGRPCANSSECATPCGRCQSPGPGLPRVCVA
jgi:hypothetical protein